MKRNKNRDRLVCGFLSLILAAGMTQGCASPQNHNSQETGEDQTPSYSYEDTDKADSGPAPAETNASSGAGKKKTPDDEKIPDDEKTPDDASKDKTDQKKNSSDASSQEEKAKKENQEKASSKKEAATVKAESPDTDKKEESKPDRTDPDPDYRRQPLKLSLLTQIKKRKASLTGPTRIPTIKNLRPLIRIAKTGSILMKQRSRKNIQKKETIMTRTALSNMTIWRKKIPVRI